MTFNGCDEATVTVPAAPYVDLGVVKTVSDDVVEPGTNLTWHVTGTNYGPAASTGFVLADELPAGVTFVSATASPALTCTTPAVGAGGAVVCTAPVVSAGTSVTLTIVGAVPSSTANGALLLNVATVSGNESEPVPDPHPNRDIAETTVARARSANPADAPAGPRSGRAAAAAAADADPAVRPSGPRRDQAQARQAGQAGSGPARRHDHLPAAGDQHRRGIGDRRPRV